MIINNKLNMMNNKKHIIVHLPLKNYVMVLIPIFIFVLIMSINICNL